jgi:hypothetical protein
VRVRGELQTLSASLEDVLVRVTDLIEGIDEQATRDDQLELVAIERGLASTLRRLQRLAARVSD